jgi:hypothetical protein
LQLRREAGESAVYWSLKMHAASRLRSAKLDDY